MKLRTTLRAICALILAIALSACGSATPGDNGNTSAPPSSTAAGGAAVGTTIDVMATDFAFALDVAQLVAGTTTFQLKNDGNARHDFAIQGEGVEQNTPIVQPGESASFTVDLKPGTYAYLCTVPGHATLGMKGSFTVK